MLPQAKKYRKTELACPSGFQSSTQLVIEQPTAAPGHCLRYNKDPALEYLTAIGRLTIESRGKNGNVIRERTGHTSVQVFDAGNRADFRSMQPMVHAGKKVV